MNLTPEQRKARTEQRQIEASQAMKEQRASERAFYQNFERLKADRLAREAAGASASAQSASK